MKLLSASAVVAGANSVALADCGLCGDKTNDHGLDTCPHFDYTGYGLSKGYKPGDEFPKNDFLGKLALADRKNADAFLTAPKSTTVSFVSDDNSDRVTTVSESDAAEMQAAAEEMKREDAAVSEAENKRRAEVHAKRLTERRRNQDRAGVEANTRDEGLQHLFGEDNMKSMARERDTQELNNMLAERRETARNLNGLGKTLDERTRDYVDNRYGMESLEWDAGRRGAEEARSVAKENRKKINISDAEKVNIEVRNTIEADDRKRAKRARARDGKELNEMVAASLAKNREDRREARELRAKDAHLQAHLRRREKEREQLTSMMKNSLSENGEREREGRLSEARDLSEKREALESAREARRREAGANELRKNNEAANKIQNAARRRLARRKAAELKDEAERQGKLQEHRENAAAKKITEALRANKERKEAQRQAQIAGDYELAKKLQAEYDAEDRQIRADRLLAEQKQLRENLKAMPVEETQNGEDFKYASEEAQDNSDAVLAAREHLGADERTSVEKVTSVADEEVETERWTLPQATAWNFKRFDFESNRRGADGWARQLDDLGIRKIECVLWLVTTSYQQLQNENKFAPTAQMAEAISDVNGIFPYSGTNSGIMNVYNAFENADTADFVQDLERLGTGELDGVLYYVANRYMHLLLSGKKAASAKFIELAKATLEHFDAVWEADEAEIVPDNEDVREAPRDPVNFKADDKGIVETEAAENSTWNPPYRVYYAYCHYIPHRLTPTRTSLKYHNEPDLFRADLRNLTIRRLETVIYLANTSYRLDLQDGAVPVNQEVAKSVEDIDRVFPKLGEGEPNARVVNAYNALKNMVDKPNDNPVSRQPFQRGFSELATNEKVTALGDMAVAYREMLRNGKPPAHPVYVNWSNAMCKALGLDGFVNGKDNVHPALKFEEFESEAKTPQVSDATGKRKNTDTAADDGKEAADNTPWEAPRDVEDTFDWRNRNDDGVTRFQNQVRGLTVRQQEALMFETAEAYTKKLDALRETPLTLPLEHSARALQGFSGKLSDRMMNVVHARKYAKSFAKELANLPDWHHQSLRVMEKILAALSQVYSETLEEGAKPADETFVKLCDCVFDAFGFNEAQEGENPNPAAREDNTVAQEVRTQFWQIPLYGVDDDYGTDDRGFRDQLGMLNIRQLEVVLVEWARVYQNFFGNMNDKARAILDAYNVLDEAADPDRVAEFRSAMEKARGKDGFEEAQSSVGVRRMNDMFEMVQGEYLRKSLTAQPVTLQFKQAVRGY